MKTTLLIAAAFASAVIAFCADTPPDLTGAKADKFKAHLGKVVCLTGRLEPGVLGLHLSGSNSNKVSFYIPYGGSTNSPTWDRLMHMQVRVTGQLQFYTWRGTKSGQFPPDYYYMVQEHTTVESVVCK